MSALQDRVRSWRGREKKAAAPAAVAG